MVNQIKIYIINKMYVFIRYTNSNYTHDSEDWKLIIEYYFYLNNTIIV